MPTYPLPPGAWLSNAGQFGASLHPPIVRSRVGHSLDPAGASLHPPIVHSRVGDSLDLWGAGLHPPIVQSRGGQDAAQGDGKLRTETAFPVPWQGVDPPWVYSGGDETLLAQALRRSHTKIVRTSDDADPEKTVDPALPFWRWGSEYRVLAATADLSGRFFVQDKSLWHVQRRAGAGADADELTLEAQRSFTLVAPTREFDYDNQIDKVVRAAVEREERLPEILSQANDLWSFFRAVTGLGTVNTPIMQELFDVVWRWADMVVMALKNEIAEPRPVQRASLVLPVIQTPAHGSLPSGHATMSALTAELLIELLYKAPHPRIEQLDRLARRIAFNRVVAGVHFPMDSAAGYALGRQMAALVVSMATGRAAPAEISFDVAKRGNEQLRESEPKGRVPLALRNRASALSVPLNALWMKALEELRVL